jgi:hypothetical protein
MLGLVDPAEVWRERVDDVLTVELGLLARRGLEPHAHGFLGPGPYTPPDGRGAIDALAGVGLLGDGDAARWRARFAGADRPFPRVEPDDELRGRLHAYLGSLAEQAHADIDDAEARLTTVLRALRRAGLLDDDEVGWWRGLLPVHDELVRPAAPAALGLLLRSVPGPSWRRRGLRVLTIDLFERGVIVRMHVARNGRDEAGGLSPLHDETSEAAPLASWRHEVLLRDDVGTSYATRGRGESGGRAGHVDGPLSLHLERVYMPATPERAKMLILYADDARIPIRL